jgi:hypothetical protein
MNSAVATTSRVTPAPTGLFWPFLAALYSILTEHGWHLLLGIFALYRLAMRVGKEEDARERARLAVEAVEPGRVAALDARRCEVVGEMARRNREIVAERRREEMARRREEMARRREERAEARRELERTS